MSGRASGLRFEPLDRDGWHRETGAFADHNYRQVWDFGVAGAERVGARSEHVLLRDGAHAFALADVRVKKLPVLGGGLAYVTGGPLTRRDGAADASRCVEAVLALRRIYCDGRGMILRVNAPVGPPSWNREVAEGLARGGFVATEAVRGYRTILVDIGRPLDAVRKTLRQKWRNCLNRSEREGLEVEGGDDATALERFAPLYDALVERKGLDVDLSLDFYLRVQRAAAAGERYLVLFASRDGRPVAGHVSSPLGDTSVYLLGATSPEALKCNAAYLLQWHAIQRAKERGCRWYDLGGIDPDANPGVYHFKTGFGGEDVTAAGPLEWVAGPRARLTRYFEARVRAARRRARPNPDAAPAEPTASEPEPTLRT